MHTPVLKRPAALRRPTLFVALLATLLALAALPFPQPSARASCAAPSLEVVGAAESPPLLRRGAQVTVVGRGFVDGCDDTFEQPSFGCSGGDEQETAAPLVDVELVLLQAQPTMDQTLVAEADAGTAQDDRLGRVEWTFTVPTRQPLGRAILKTEGSEPLRVRIGPPE